MLFLKYFAISRDAIKIFLTFFILKLDMLELCHKLRLLSLF